MKTSSFLSKYPFLFPAILAVISSVAIYLYVHKLTHDITLLTLPATASGFTYTTTDKEIILPLKTFRDTMRWATVSLIIIMLAVLVAALFLLYITLLEINKAETDKLKLNAILQELEVASKIQQTILPKKFIHTNEIELYATMDPAKEIGGDFYDFFYLNNHTLAFVIADVSDKGVPAALFMTVARTLIHANAVIHITPAQCLQQVNNILASENKNMMFVTAFYGQIDLQTGVVAYANAGHVHPLVIKKDGHVNELFAAPGMPLGIQESFNYTEGSLELEPQDTLFVYTDGLTDAVNKDENKFGLQNIVAILRNNKDKTIKELITILHDEINDFSKDKSQFDDIAMLALRYKPE